MRITVDTNILIRAVMGDDIKQAAAAAALLKEATLIAVPVPCLREFVWVLRRVYGVGQRDIRAALQALLAARNVAVNRPAVDAGLAMLNAGGDFADDLIAFEGQWLGGKTFVSFDRKAVALLEQQGQAARVSSEPFGLPAELVHCQRRDRSDITEVFRYHIVAALHGDPDRSKSR